MNISRTFMAGIAIACCLGIAACERPANDLSVEMLDTPAGAGSFASQLFVANGRASVSWLETVEDGHVLRYALWQGDGWSEAREVTRGGDWFANWADLPGVRPRSDGGWLAWWLQKSGPGTYAYDVQLAISDDGSTWHALGTPHHDGTQTEHGFVSVFDLPAEKFGMAWLDGRNSEPPQGEHMHGHGGGMTLRYSIFDGEKQQIEAELDELVCDCCATDSAQAGDAIVLVYRGRTEEEVRDIYARRFTGGRWSEAVRVHADEWRIPGCPVNGPAVAANGEHVAVAWFTAPNGDGEVRLAMSIDGGRSFGKPVRIDDGRPEGRADVVIHPQFGVLASWVEKTEAGAQVRIRAVGRGGEPGESSVLVHADASRASGFPRLAVVEDGTVLMTWTDVGDAGRQVRSARLHMQ